MSLVNFYYVYITHYLIYKYNTASKTENPGKAFRIRHLHLENYLKAEIVSQTGSVSAISSKCCCLLYVPTCMKICTEMVVKLFMIKLSFFYENHFLKLFLLLKTVSVVVNI